MAKAPAFQFYASDFKMDTEHWTVAETGIYIRLLMNQWVNKELPTEPSRLARIAGCDVRTFNKNWRDTIAKKFTANGQGMLQNSKLESIRKERTEFIENAIESGRLGGLKTQENKRKQSSNPLSNPSSENKPLLLLSSSSTSKDIKTAFAANVKLTEKEYKSLLAKAFNGNKNLLKRAIEKLDAYKESNGKTYKSDAGAIRSWVVDEINCEKRPSNGNGKNKINFKKEWQLILDSVRKQDKGKDLPAEIQKVVKSMRGMAEIGRMPERDGFFKYMEIRKEFN